MGQNNSNLTSATSDERIQKIFAELDKDNDGHLNLSELMSLETQENAPGYVTSPMFLFRFDSSQEGSINRNEFAQLLKHLRRRAHVDDEQNEQNEQSEQNENRNISTRLRHALRKKEQRANNVTSQSSTVNTPDAVASSSSSSDASSSSSSSSSSSNAKKSSGASKRCWTALDLETARQIQFDRDQETPMIIGRKPVSGNDDDDNNGHKNTDDDDDQDDGGDDEEDQVLAGTSEFCDNVLSTRAGRRKFVSWLWRLADMDGTHRISMDELKAVLVALEKDGINLSSLAFSEALPKHAGSSAAAAAASTDELSLRTDESASECDDELMASVDSPALAVASTLAGSGSLALPLKKLSFVAIGHKAYKFLIFDMPSDAQLDKVMRQFIQNDVSHLVSLCAERERTYCWDRVVEAKIECIELAGGFPDGGLPTLDVVDRWRGIVKKAKKKGGCVACHARSGAGRAPVLVAISLIEMAGMKNLDAVQLARERCRGSINSTQLQMLCSYSKKKQQHLLPVKAPDDVPAEDSLPPPSPKRVNVSAAAASSGNASPAAAANDDSVDASPVGTLDSVASSADESPPSSSSSATAKAGQASIEKIMQEFDSGGTGYLSKQEFMLLAKLIVHAYRATAKADKKFTIGKYVVGDKIGEGACGVVHLAANRKSGEQKAIKIIPRGNVSDLSRLDVEVRAMMMLKHPTIVELEEVLENEDSVFFVMELLGGGSLADYVDVKPLSEDLARTYFATLVEGLAYCHAQGVAHRDLKLESMLKHKKVNDEKGGKSD
jgi:Ca2+-binding EF-hand superfamily protein